MPRSWSEAVKACRKHPRKVNGRWCTCKGVGWRYRVSLPDPVTGRSGPPEWSRTFPTKDAADRDQRETRQAIVERRFVRDRGQTVADYLREWLEGKSRAERKGSTIAGYRGVIENHLIPQLGAHRLGDLRPDHVQGMLDRIAASPSRRRGKGAGSPVTAGTLRNVRAVLRAALSDAVKRQLIPRNVAQLVTLPAVRRTQPVAIEPDRMARFLAYSGDDPLAVLWLVDAVYGLRRGEVVGLRWQDIDERTNIVRISQTITDVAGSHPCPYCGKAHARLLFGTPKSAAGERCYPLVPAVAAALTDHRQRQDHERELYGRDYADHELVFAQPDGNPCRPDWVSREFRRLMTASGAAAGLARVPSLKAMRSTMVTRLHEEGVPLEVISTVTGHAGGGVTREHYLSVAAERTRPEYAALATRLSGGRSDQRSDQTITATLVRQRGGSEN